MRSYLFTFVSKLVALVVRPQGVSARQKLLSLLTFVTGPEVLGVDLQEGSKAPASHAGCHASSGCLG